MRIIIATSHLFRKETTYVDDHWKKFFSTFGQADKQQKYLLAEDEDEETAQHETKS